MTMTFARKSRVAAALALALGMSSAAVAQETSSSMRGKIVGPEGNPAANTKIVLIHQPSGTVRELTTNESGAFLAKGLRVGGPYTVIVDSDTFRDKVEEGLSLTLGETYRFNVQLEAVQEDMERIVVTGTIPVSSVGGSSSAFGAEDIANLPSFNRDVKDIARLNPLVSISGNGEMSVAGSNPRGNSFTVDGIGQNDDFGLNYGGYPTEQPPISLDAIEQVSVDVSPFSAKKGGFTGAQINAVTKSGTNEFKGSLFFETMQPSWSGDVERPNQQFVEALDFRGNERNFPVLDELGRRVYEDTATKGNEKTSTFGMSLGGPIIEDKLFFFTVYDQWKRVLEMDYGFDGSNAANEFDGITEDDYKKFLGILNDTYGLTDSIGGNPEDKDRKWLTKLSWNINDAHRLDLTYQWQDNKDERNFASGGSTLSLDSRRYVYHTRVNNISTKLYSDWNDDFSTEIGLSYKDVTAASITNSDFGAVSVSIDDDIRGPGFSFGRDSNRHDNHAENQNLKLNVDANYLYGEHDIRFGLQAEYLTLYNRYARNALGDFAYNGLENFQTGTLNIIRDAETGVDVYDLAYSNAYTNNSQDTEFEVNRTTLALYLEDNFALTDDIELTLGLRYERLFSSDTPEYNDEFAKTYENLGYDNQENLDGLDILLPRIGFTWYASDDLTVRGGVGRFYGGMPNVWYTNPFANDGLTYVTADPVAINSVLDADNGRASFTSVPESVQGLLNRGGGNVNFTDPDFELPSDWRVQLGVEYNFDIPYLGEDFSWNSEIVYTKRENEAVWKDVSRLVSSTLSDGERQVMSSIYGEDGANRYDIMLTNADENSRSIILTNSLNKSWDNGISMRASYSYQDVTEVVAGSSSSADGNYQHNIAVNRNEYHESRGSYEIEHTFKLTLGYKTEFFEGYQTKFDLFFERRSGRPYSWKMGMFGDYGLGDQFAFNSSSGYLPYIPTGADDPNVEYSGFFDTGTVDEDGKRVTVPFEYAHLQPILQAAGVEGYAGQIVPKNFDTQPWVTTLDLNIQQEIPGFMDGHKGIFYFTIDNLANLLNKDWGREYRFIYPQQSLYDFGGVTDDGKYILSPAYNGFDTRNYSSVNTNASIWRIKMGVRYTF